MNWTGNRSRTTPGIGQRDAHIAPSQVAMLFKGSETYGIGTIAKLYASGAPGIRFVCMREGALTEWLRDGGHHVEVVHDLRSLDLRPGLRRARLLSAWWEAKRSAHRLHARLFDLGIRVIHTHWYPQQLIAGHMRRLGYFSVWQINNYLNRGWLFGLRRAVHHRIAEWGADLLLPASDFVAEDWRGARVGRATVRNAAVPIMDRLLSLPETPIRCVAAGRLADSKGHHVAVEAVLAARRAGLDVRLDVYGGPLDGNGYADDLRRSAREAGHAQAIRLLGFVPDLRQRHPRYHLALQCRIDPEPCSLWVCEAQADGLPVLASASGGTPELVDDGVTGVLYPPGNARALSESLIALARDPERLAAMRRAAFDKGQSDLSVERFVRETFLAYRVLASRTQ